jgi:hypothetical protein
MDEIRLESYSKALVESFADDADTLVVLDQLSNTRRDAAAFEAIIPPKPDLIHLVKKVGWARKRAAREAAEAEQAKAEAAAIAAERAAGTFTHLDIDGAIAKAYAAKERKAEWEAQGRPYKPTVTPFTECPHCGNQASPLGSVDLRRLAAYYTKKAERAEDREARLAGTVIVQGEAVYFDPGAVMGGEFLESAMQERVEQNVSRGTLPLAPDASMDSVTSRSDSCSS